MADQATIEIRSPGMLTTVQDLGRPGQARFGVAPGGALDRASLILGNRLLDNDPGAAALEITLLGPTIVFMTETVFALAGADLGARLAGAGLPVWQPILAHAGDELSFTPSPNSTGARCYLCVAGGIAVDPVMESRATDLIGGFGGLEGRALRTGDQIPVGQPAQTGDDLLRRRLKTIPASIERGLTARVVLGPQAARFTDAGRSTFLNSEFTVSPKSNRQGLRLSGPTIEHLRGADMISEGIAHGAIQVPGDGLPIVLLAARQTVGGYVKIATVIGADLDRFGQARPTEPVRFRMVDVDEARRAMLARRAWLDEIEVESNHVYSGFDRCNPTMNTTKKEIEALAGSWDPEGVVRVIEAIERTGATSFSLEVAGAGLKLELRRDGSPLTSSAADASPAPNATVVSTSTTVVAPVLGVLYRRAAPDQPLLIEDGAEVTAGQPICVIEVMKTYHEVTSPHAGRLVSFLVPDGQYVEYGQAIAEIA